MADMRTITDSDEKERRNLNAEICRLKIENAELADLVDCLGRALAKFATGTGEPWDDRDRSAMAWVIKHFPNMENS